MDSNSKSLLIFLIIIVFPAILLIYSKSYLSKPSYDKISCIFTKYKTLPLHYTLVNTETNLEGSQLHYGNLLIQLPENIMIEQQPSEENALVLDLCYVETVTQDKKNEESKLFAPRIWLQHYHIDTKEYNAGCKRYTLISALLDILKESFWADTPSNISGWLEEINLPQRASNEYFFMFTLHYQTGYILVQGMDIYIVREMTLESNYSFSALLDNKAVMWSDTLNKIEKKDNNQNQVAYQKVEIDTDNLFLVQKWNNKVIIIKNNFSNIPFLVFFNEIRFEDFNFDGYADILLDNMSVYLWNKEKRKWKLWQPPKDFTNMQNSVCISQTKTIWTYDADLFLTYEKPTDVLWKWEEDVLVKKRECITKWEDDKIRVFVYKENKQSAWMDTLFSAEEWEQNSHKKAVFFQQFFMGMVPEEIYGKKHTLSNYPRYIPQALLDKMANALLDNTVRETCIAMINRSELTEDDVMTLAKDDITLRNMVLEMKWHYTMLMADGDNDGILDILSAEPNGGSNGCTYYVFYKGQKDGSFQRTSSYEMVREFFDIINYEGKNYLCRRLFDYTTKMDNGISLSYYVDGKWAEKIDLKLFVVEYQVELSKCSNHADKPYATQIMENAQNYKKAIDEHYIIDGNGEVRNEKYEYQCDFDNDGTLEQYTKSIWDPTNIHTAQHIVLEGDGECLDYIREVINSVDGIANMMWVDQNNGENIINVISRIGADDFVISVC